MSYKKKLVWREVPKPKPTKYEFTPVGDVNRLILLYLPIGDLKNITLNKKFQKIVADPNFWCEWIKFHYSSAVKEDCEFLAKISSSKLFNKVFNKIEVVIQNHKNNSNPSQPI